MPQQTNNVHHTPLHNCARCQFPYHISELVWQRGELVCVEKCFDNPDVFWRQRYIGYILAGSDQELKPDPMLTNPQSVFEEF